jgi:hypothetical protein
MFDGLKPWDERVVLTHASAGEFFLLTYYALVVLACYARTQRSMAEAYSGDGVYDILDQPVCFQQASVRALHDARVPD